MGKFLLQSIKTIIILAAQKIISCLACHSLIHSLRDAFEIHKFRNGFTTCSSSLSFSTCRTGRVRFSNVLQVLEVIRSELVDDTRQKILKFLGFAGSANHIGVGTNGRLHFRGREVDDIPVILEEVHLFDRRDVGYSQSFQLALGGRGGKLA